MNQEQEFVAFRDWPEEQVCRLIAVKVRKLRKDSGESQTAFASRAGVPLRTFKRFEADGRGTVLTLIQILRALGRTAYLISLFPQLLPPPKVRTLDAQASTSRAGDLVEMAKEKAGQVDSRMREERRRTPDRRV